MKPKVFETVVEKNVYTIFLSIWFVVLTVFIAIFSFNIITSRTTDELLFFLAIMIVIWFVVFKFLKRLYYGKDIIIILDDNIVIDKTNHFFFRALKIPFKNIFKIDYKMFRNRRIPWNVYGKIRIKYYGGEILFGESLNEHESVQSMKSIVAEIKLRGFPVKSMLDK